MRSFKVQQSYANYNLPVSYLLQSILKIFSSLLPTYSAKLGLNRHKKKKLP